MSRQSKGSENSEEGRKSYYSKYIFFVHYQFRKVQSFHSIFIYRREKGAILTPPTLMLQ